MKWIHFLPLVGLTAALTACPARGDVPRTPTLDITGPNTLEIGAPIRFTVTATDTTGATVANPNVTYTTSDPTVLTVDGNGNVDVKRLSFAPVTITATYAGVSDTLSVTTYGLELIGGTARISSSANVGSAFFLRLREPGTTNVAATTAVSIVGPNGFNGGAPLSLALASGTEASTWDASVARTAVAGTYTATATIDGEAYSARATIDPTSTLPLRTSAIFTLTRAGVVLDTSQRSDIGAVQGRVFSGNTFVGGSGTIATNQLPYAGTWRTPLPTGAYTRVFDSFSFDPVATGPKPAQFNVAINVLDELTLTSASAARLGAVSK